MDEIIFLSLLLDKPLPEITKLVFIFVAIVWVVVIGFVFLTSTK